MQKLVDPKAERTTGPASNVQARPEIDMLGETRKRFVNCGKCCSIVDTEKESQKQQLLTYLVFSISTFNLLLEHPSIVQTLGLIPPAMYTSFSIFVLLVRPSNDNNINK